MIAELREARQTEPQRGTDFARELTPRWRPPDHRGDFDFLVPRARRAEDRFAFEPADPIDECWLPDLDDLEARESVGRTLLGRFESDADADPSAQPVPKPAVAKAHLPDEDDFLLRLYLREAQAEPELTAPEEAELAWLARFGDDSARERLVRSHLLLVVRIAGAYRGYCLSLADLISEGNLGLMRAAELFNPIHQVRFAHYAAVWIRQRIRRALSYQGWPLRLPASLVWLRGRVRAAAERLQAASGREPTDAEVAAETTLSLRAVRRLRATADLCFLSLQADALPNGHGRTLAELLPDESAVAPDEALAVCSDHEFVGRLFATLQPRERQVLGLRFGLDGGPPRTLEEVGRELGCVRQNVQYLEAAALRKLRQRARLMGDERASGRRAAVGSAGTPALRSQPRLGPPRKARTSRT